MKPELLSFQFYGGYWTAKVLINEKTYSYNLPDNIQTKKMLNSKYFGFKTVNWMKKNQIYIPE